MDRVANIPGNKTVSATCPERVSSNELIVRRMQEILLIKPDQQ
jgi:hypothetical protein